MPSLVEGFGLVYGEALGAGLFCIGTANTGLPDMNLSENEALLVSVGDIAELSHSLHTAYRKWKIGDLNKDEFVVQFFI